MTTGFKVAPDPEPTASIFLTTSKPWVTEPKTTCLPSSQSVLTVQRKNLCVCTVGAALLYDRYAMILIINLRSLDGATRSRRGHDSKAAMPSPPRRRRHAPQSVRTGI